MTFEDAKKRVGLAIYDAVCGIANEGRNVIVAFVVIAEAEDGETVLLPGVAGAGSRKNAEAAMCMAASCLHDCAHTVGPNEAPGANKETLQ